MNSMVETQIDKYLASLRAGLPNLSVAEREEIIREISVHIRESVEEPGVDIENVLARMGSPEELAAQYRTDGLIKKATRGFSPLSVLRACLELTKRGIEGLILFLIALFGYGSALGFIATACMKPFMPKEVGLWVGPHFFDFGVHPGNASNPAIHEVLGRWYIPVTLYLGFIFLVVTTYGVRWLLKRSKGRAPIFIRNQTGMLSV